MYIDSILATNYDSIVTQVSNEVTDASQPLVVSENVTHDVENASGNCNDCFLDLKRFRSKNVKKLIIAGLNINSLRNKFHPVNDILQKGYVDILCISESKLDDSFPKSQFKSHGFHCFRQDSTARSGGLIAWVRNDLPCRQRDDIAVNDGEIQSLIIEMRVKKEKWIIVALYRLPNANVKCFCSRLSTMLDKIAQECKMCIVVGDINIDVSPRNTVGNELHAVMDIYNLKNVVKDPTCFKGTPSLIDVIMTSNARRVGDVLNFNCGLSDFHNLVATCTKVEVHRSKAGPISYRSFRRFNDDDFREDMARIPVSVLDVFDDISDKQWAYDRLVMSVVDQHAPLKTRYVTKQCAHMNSTLRKAIYRKRTAHNKYLNNKKSQHLWEEYRQARNHFVKVNRLSMQNYFKKACRDGPQSKSFWNTLKPYFTDKGQQKSSIMLREGDDVITDSHEVAKVFNDYFHDAMLQMGNGDDISDVSVDGIIDKYATHESINVIKSSFNRENHFCFTHVTADHVCKMLSQVDKKKSTGYDGLSAKLVCKAADVLAPTITRLINDMLNQCSFPDGMKYAEISPIFKKDNALDKTKYRPVSVLTCVSKIFEKILNEQFADDFYANYARDLAAYRKGYNTQSVLLKAVDDWKLALDQGNVVGALLMDLSKAFDVIPHGLLLAKMEAYGYSRNVITTIRSYLCDRKQRVKINDARSEWNLTNIGVPQGSVLGPTLFNVFLNDLFLYMNGSNIYNYADDNTLSYVSSSLNDLVGNIERRGCMMTEWFQMNGMKANPEKYQAIIFGKRPKSAVLLGVSGAQIESQHSVRLLGITIDDDLIFREHALAVCRRAARQVDAMMRVRSFLDEETRRQMYHSFIFSCFTYCPAVWLICSKTSLSQLEKVHCRALRFLYNEFDLPYCELLLKGHHKSMTVVLMHSIATEVYKSLNEIGPSYMSSKFVRKENRYDMRNQHALIQKSFNTIKNGYHSFSYLGAKIWNSLPNEIKSSPSLSVFRNRLEGFNDCSCLERMG